MNKKRTFGFLAILAIAAMAAWNVNVNIQKDRLSDILLENVEALAWEHVSTLDCYSNCTPDPMWYCTITLYYLNIEMGSVTCNSYKPGFYGYY
ncbi:MAG: hypothetical protein LBG28_04820 [Tannerella sp.]|jgi:hypothetical protein|nr:hypothetical protein [Tannerella sp.]